MKLQQRSYGGKIFRPKPLVHQEENLLIVATCWGVGDQTSLVVDEISKCVVAAASDVEVTSPFEYWPCLSSASNGLRRAVLLANELVYRTENKSEYRVGYEVLVLYKNKTQLTWAQVGGPAVLVKRPQRSLLPLLTQQDVSGEFAGELSPIPVQLLGLESSCQVICGDSLWHENDQLVLASCSRLPRSFWTESQNSEISLEKVTEWMVKENPDTPFWLATIDE